MKTGRVYRDGAVRDLVVADDGTMHIANGGTVVVEDPDWAPPAHGSVICVALNFSGHLAQFEDVFREPPYQAPPGTPVLFIKPENTITAHNAPVLLPDGVPAIQPGPALAVVIGRTIRRIAARDALDCIKGYTVFNDFSLPEESYFRPPIRTKCVDSWGPLGPCVVSRDAVSDPHDLGIRLHVNGELRQQGSTRDLVRRIPELMESITAFMTLREDDILVTGFPPGRVDVSAGDRVSVDVEGIGVLENRVVRETEFTAVDSMEATP